MRTFRILALPLLLATNAFAQEPVDSAINTQIRSDINYRIERLFRQAGIEIPFPQTELRLRGGALQLDTEDRLVADEKSGDVEPH